ncbi:P-loop NTPase fold protein [Viridibacterium curvum]|uniref:Photosynthesis system II assembly factor Ycf48/Hcf136-like domain-containing protein n=1 Tax=Viridibacterium curvum TaxID=1101404 RepID=A0ABP9QQF8_9RHOO
MVEMQGGSSPERPQEKGGDAPRGAPAPDGAQSPAYRNAPLVGIVLSLVLLAVATAFAIRQAPHPDMLRPVGNWDVGNPGWWAWPLERNAFKRQIIRGHLRDVYRLPGTSQLWAVGEGGLILHSTDGGEHWTQQHPEPPKPRTTSFNLISAAQAFDGPDIKQAYTSQSKAAPSDKLPSQNQSYQNQQVQQTVLPESRVPAADSKSAPVADKGQAARPQPRATPRPEPKDPLTADLSGVYFIDAQLGWAVGGNGAVLKTEDGGESWTVVNVGAETHFGGVVFSADGKRGWVLPAQSSGAARVSQDGGRSWSASSLGSLSMLDAAPALGSDRNALALRGNARGLLRNGGKESWFIEPAGAGSRLSRERGQPRETQVLAEWPDFRALALQVSADGQRIVLSGERGMIRSSRDGGRSWQDATAVGGDLHALQCDDALDDCLIVGDQGTVLRGNLERGWRRITAGAGANLLWARVGSSVDIDVLTANNLQLRSRDEGETWSVLARNTLPADVARTGSVQPSRFIDGKYQWRVGPQGYAERSDDGGKTVSLVNTGTQAWLTGVVFLADHQRGWIAGDDGSILATRDGGATWQKQGTPTRNWLWHIGMNPDGRTGRAVGAYGTVLLTRDGGAHWREAADYVRYPAPWYWLVFVACGIALAVLVPRHLRSRQPSVNEGEGAAAAFDSDQPVTDVKQDRLGYRPAVEAMADFLRNAATEPRITVAITGEWGSGKSSMMRMLQTEMAAKGYRTAWFNAWHHQQEGRQLTALFNVVRRQAVPKFFRQPLAALRVRSRLIWGRSAFYKFVCVAVPLFALVALGDFSRQSDALERLKWWTAHQLLQWDRVVITDKSLDKLKPVLTRTAAESSSSSAAADPDGSDAPPMSTSTAGNVKAAVQLSQRSPVRPEVFNYMKSALVWESGSGTPSGRCGDKRNIADEDRCVFKQPAQLIATIEQRVGPLWPSEREAILKAAESIPLKPLFPALEHFIVPLLGLFTLLFTRGMTVYGLQILAPLQSLLGAKSDNGGKEASGSVEHYRREFCLLTEALDGRLLIFIDDIDRCNPDTVNSIMELTNYLVDVGRCFVVLGMAMERVKASIKPPNDKAEADYADKYLRKLVHIELPVPIASAQESLGLFAQRKLSPEDNLRKTERRRWLVEWWHLLRPWLLRLMVLAGVLAMMTAAVSTGRLLNNYRQLPALKIVEPDRVATAPAATARGGATSSSALPAAPDNSAQVPEADLALGGGDIGLSEPEVTNMPWRWLGFVALVLIFALALRSSSVLQERVLLALGSALRTRDSERFREAVQLWLDVVRLHDNTPRGIKRFCNRARLLSIYEKQDVAALKREGQADLEPTPEMHIVALAAIHHVSPAALQSVEGIAGNRIADLAVSESPTHASFRDIEPYLKRHKERFGWPDHEVIARFIERVKRISVR